MGKWFGTQISSIVALGGAMAAVGWIGNTVYHVATDAFVAPIVLSPESDLVIQSKLSMSQLVAERIRLMTRKDEIEAEIQAATQAVEQLRSLQEVSARALDWSTATTAHQAHGGQRELAALAQQKTMIDAMVASQDAQITQLKKDVDAGLASKVDYARELQTMNQLRIAGIENDRAQVTSQMNLGQLALTQHALRGQGLMTPEMLVQQDQIVRVKCDLLKLEAELRAKTSERRHIDDELGKLDDLVGQLRKRPVFRATEANTNVAFVPYTQMSGVHEGASVFDCVWGVAVCKKVGHVSELLPGEVIVPDPWGTPARGQYAIMELEDPAAAQSRTLRVRPST